VRRRSAEIGSLAITKTFITFIHYFAREQQPPASTLAGLGHPKYSPTSASVAPVKGR
jgi:hypothetical protein